MNFYTFSPNWFIGIDSIFELLIILILILISIYSYKTFQFSQNSNYLYLSISFALMILAYLFKIGGNVIFIIFQYNILTSNQSIFILEIIESLSILLHKFTLISAFLILLYISSKKQKSKSLIFMSMFLTISTIIINSYQLFFILITLINFIIILNLIYFNKNTQSILVIFFILLTISYSILTLAPIFNSFYILGELGLLLSYSILLFNFIKIFKT